MLISKTISWDAPPSADGVTQTILMIGLNSLPLTDQAGVPAPATSIVANFNAVIGDTINYAVRHTNSSGTSSPSTVVSYIVPAPPVPSAPTGVVLS